LIALHTLDSLRVDNAKSRWLCVVRARACYWRC